MHPRVFENVADITGPDAQRFSRDHRGLGGDQRVAACQQQIPVAGQAGRDPFFTANGFHIAKSVEIKKALIICHEKQNPRGGGDERLIIAGDSQAIF